MAVNYESHVADWKKVKKSHKDFYHQYLPMILVGIDVGYVGEETIDEIMWRVRTARYFDTEKGYIQFKKMLLAVMPVTTNVSTGSRAEYLKRTNRNEESYSKKWANKIDKLNWRTVK